MCWVVFGGGRAVWAKGGPVLQGHRACTSRHARRRRAAIRGSFERGYACRLGSAEVRFPRVVPEGFAPTRRVRRHAAHGAPHHGLRTPVDHRAAVAAERGRQNRELPRSTRVQHCREQHHEVGRPRCAWQHHHTLELGCGWRSGCKRLLLGLFLTCCDFAVARGRTGGDVSPLLARRATFQRIRPGGATGAVVREGSETEGGQSPPLDGRVVEQCMSCPMPPRP